MHASRAKYNSKSASTCAASLVTSSTRVKYFSNDFIFSLLEYPFVLHLWSGGDSRVHQHFTNSTIPAAFNVFISVGWATMISLDAGGTWAVIAKARKALLLMDPFQRSSCRRSPLWGSPTSVSRSCSIVWRAGKLLCRAMPTQSTACRSLASSKKTPRKASPQRPDSTIALCITPAKFCNVSEWKTTKEQILGSMRNIFIYKTGCALVRPAGLFEENSKPHCSFFRFLCPPWNLVLVFLSFFKPRKIFYWFLLAMWITKVCSRG